MIWCWRFCPVHQCLWTTSLPITSLNHSNYYITNNYSKSCPILCTFYWTRMDTGMPGVGTMDVSRVKNKLAAPWEHSGLVCSLPLYKVPGFFQQVNSFILRLSWAIAKHSRWQINCVMFSGKYLATYIGIWKMFTTVSLVLLLLGEGFIRFIYLNDQHSAIFDTNKF